MTDYNDFIKPILYPEILPIRLKHWYIERIAKLVGRDFTENELLNGFYAMMHYHEKSKIPFDQMDKLGMPPEYVFEETKRCVEGVAGKANVYPGVGFDVPWHLPEGGIEPRPSEPDVVHKSTMAAFNAGAQGVVASRDYDEMQLSSLKAFGDAVRYWKKNNR